MNSLRPLLRLACGLTVLAVLASLAARHWWLADLCANLRVQLGVALALISITSLMCRDVRTTVVAFLVLTSQTPWFFANVTEAVSAPSSNEILITSANVYTQNRRHQDILTQFLSGNADIIVVLELSSQLEKFLAGGFADVYPYSLTKPQDHGNFGIGVYSKHPIVDAKFISFEDADIPSILLTTAVRGQPLHVLATHTLPPMGMRAFHHRNQHLSAAANLLAGLRADDPDTPVIVAGDLNLTPWSPIFYDFCGSAGLQPFLGDPAEPTWYRYPVFPCGLVLDHVLFSSDLVCVSRTVGPDVGSDHRFVTAALSLIQDD